MSLKRLFLPAILMIVVTASVTNYAIAQRLEDFQNPPSSCKALTWWHWINGNVTKTGIRKDLEAMQKVGVGGLILFNVGFYSAGDSPFMSDAWWNHVAYAMQKADSLGLKFGVFNSDGWSMSGGPWIEPEESMKQLVWTDTTIQGGSTLKLKLAHPGINLIYHDIATLAFPAIQHDNPLVIHSIVNSRNVADRDAAVDGNSGTEALFSLDNGQIPTLTVGFDSITSVRRIVFDNVRANNFLTAYATIEYSTDEENYQEIDKTIPLNLKSESAIKTFTLSFPEIKARYIRMFVHFNETEKNTPFPIFQDKIGIGEITFFQSPRVGLWESKSGQSKRIRHDRQQLNQKEMAEVDEETLAKEWIISTKDMINLTNHVDKDGNLTWKAPSGEWTILRLGYTSTGRMNAPASNLGRGLECDKMDPNAVRKHFDGYVAKMNDLSLQLRGKPLDFMQMESWEAGIQNWTRGFEKEFEKRNGYSILPWLPVMAGGRVVNSSEESNRFLWDLRRTFANMICENYWTVMNQLAREKGIEVLGEGSGMQHYLYDPVLYQKTNDLPMGEFWTTEQGPRADCKNAASVAHVYGKKLAAAEAFTGGGEKLWRLTPFDFKKIGDEAFTMGINQLVLHSYVHQPYDIAPGFTLDQFGNHFQRLNSWYKHSDGWLSYMARSQYMLRQGDLVTDVCYFTGEGIPGYLGLRKELAPHLPDGYDYDGVGLEKIKEMTVIDGKLHLPNGAGYFLLVIPETGKMTPEFVQEIDRLVRDGATIVSVKPQSSPSLAGYPECDKTVKNLADKVWGKPDGRTVKENKYGKGRVVWGIPLDELLDSMKAEPDFSYVSNADSASINYIHRKVGNTEIYFLANNQKKALDATCFFRTWADKKIAGIWDPDKGDRTLAEPLHSSRGWGFPLHFDPLGSMFIVIGDSTAQSFAKRPEHVVSEKVIQGEWKLSFPSGSGNDEHITLNKLMDWTKSEDPKMKYFSGTASYKTEFTVEKNPDENVWLDLGEVKNIARVFVNDTYWGNLWKPPFQIDITEALRKGKNSLTIEVTNTSVNQMIGDEQLPTDTKYRSFPGPVTELPSYLKSEEKRKSGRKTFVTYTYFGRDSALEPSGLLGPVKTITVKRAMRTSFRPRKILF